jgi:hypothetical protein
MSAAGGLELPERYREVFEALKRARTEEEEAHKRTRVAKTAYDSVVAEAREANDFTVLRALGELSRLDFLPPEMLLYVAKFLPPASRAALMGTCVKFRDWLRPLDRVGMLDDLLSAHRRLIEGPAVVPTTPFTVLIPVECPFRSRYTFMGIGFDATRRKIIIVRGHLTSLSRTPVQGRRHPILAQIRHFRADEADSPFHYVYSSCPYGLIGREGDDRIVLYDETNTALYREIVPENAGLRGIYYDGTHFVFPPFNIVICCFHGSRCCYTPYSHIHIKQGRAHLKYHPPSHYNHEFILPHGDFAVAGDICGDWVATMTNDGLLSIYEKRSKMLVTRAATKARNVSKTYMVFDRDGIKLYNKSGGKLRYWILLS